MKIHTATVFKGGSVTDKNKIISVSLFRMKHSYRGFSKYLDDCIRFISIVKEYLPTFFLRIYIDDSVLQNEIELLKDETVEIVKYRCDTFWDSHTKTHEGIFGMFVRFLPMFSAQKFDTMISSDIDLGPFHVKTFKLLDETADKIGFFNTTCFNRWIPTNMPYNILGGGIVSKIVFPRQLIMKFLEHVRDNKIKALQVKSTDADTSMPYGIDELFLNSVLLPYIQLHKIHVVTFTMSSVVGAMRIVLKNIKDKPETADKYMKTLLHLNTLLWTEPEKVDSQIFFKYVKKILPIIRPYLETSEYNQCVSEYEKDPVLFRMKSYN